MNAKYRKERNWRDVSAKKWKIFMEEKLINYQKGGAWSYIMTVIIQQFNEKGKRIATYTIVREYRSAYLFVSFPSYRTSSWNYRSRDHNDFIINIIIAFVEYY